MSEDKDDYEDELQVIQTKKYQVALLNIKEVPRSLKQIEEVEESSNQMNAVDYEDLTSFKRYNVGEDGTDLQSEGYLAYAKALQKRVRAKLQKKVIMASLKAGLQLKAQLESQLHLIKANKKDKQILTKQHHESERNHLKEELRLQQEIKKALGCQLQALEMLTSLADQKLTEFPRDKMATYVQMMHSESEAMQTAGAKISHQLDLQQVLLENLEQIISELPFS